MVATGDCEITMYSGGTKQRQVRLADYRLPDARDVGRRHPAPEWGDAILFFHRTVCRVRFAVEAGEPLPPLVWVPDLWFACEELADDDRELVISAWHEGVTLLRHYGYRSDQLRERTIGAAVYHGFDLAGAGR